MLGTARALPPGEPQTGAENMTASWTLPFVSKGETLGGFSHMEVSLPEDVTACLMSQGGGGAVSASWEPPQASPPVFPHWGLHVGGKLW